MSTSKLLPKIVQVMWPFEEEDEGLVMNGTRKQALEEGVQQCLKWKVHNWFGNNVTKGT